MPLITYKSDENGKKLATDLGLSQVATVRLAIDLLAKLSTELSQGARLLIRGTDGKEKEIIVPQLKTKRHK